MSLLSDDIIHDINQGSRQQGKAAFEKFLDKMDRAYDEEIKDLVVMVSQDGQKAAAEFSVHGTYVKTDPGLPEARGQKYVITAGAFFDVDPEKKKVLRVSTYYNLPQWIEIVSR